MKRYQTSQKSQARNKKDPINTGFSDISQDQLKNSVTSLSHSQHKSLNQLILMRSRFVNSYCRQDDLSTKLDFCRESPCKSRSRKQKRRINATNIRFWRNGGRIEDAHLLSKYTKWVNDYIYYYLRRFPFVDLSQISIAKYFGISRTHVNRVIQDLHEAGFIIKINRGFLKYAHSKRCVYKMPPFFYNVDFINKYKEEFPSLLRINLSGGPLPKGVPLYKMKNVTQDIEYYLKINIDKKNGKKNNVFNTNLRGKMNSMKKNQQSRNKYPPNSQNNAFVSQESLKRERRECYLPWKGHEDVGIRDVPRFDKDEYNKVMDDIIGRPKFTEAENKTVDDAFAMVFAACGGG